ncbi:MAG: hypothetical protein [Podoviridae sp. ctdb7]|nr:MAG: hypothetical protein [Podoviridae sp. ctdb7]
MAAVFDVVFVEAHGRTLTAIRPPFMITLKRRFRLATGRSRGWPITSLKGRPKPSITSLASISSHCSSIRDLTGAVLIQPPCDAVQSGAHARSSV